ncbi:MAG TPA: Rieske 2Fe-2S domain-containing protein, partial [Thermoanaerobaculia bacterium]|nr:Rieske 2Fe-2S domain-containing protein [Thermoanaerobaculia bacterium]
GSALGHPLHPALIALPVGAWTLAAIFDAIELAGGGQQGKFADRAIGVGVLGALAAAVAGITDWSETDGRAKRIGLTHGAMNVAATGLYALSLLLRRRSRPAGISVGMLAFGIAASSAFLGGHLTYGEQIGVDHTATADQGKPEDFVAVLDNAALTENKPTRVTADGVAVLLVRQGEKIFALTETCTHLGGPLAEGRLEGESIRCPWHGSRFCVTNGRVLEGPAVFPERVFEVRVSDGKIEVRAAQEQ